MFCATWEVGPSRPQIHLVIYLVKFYQEFDFIIKGYCRKNRSGDSYVRRDDYEVMRAQDSRIIVPSKLASTVEPGMVLEISIFLRQNATAQNDKMKCPRCRYINLNACDWIRWKVPLSFYTCCN
jgi:hypothetical protein